MLRLIVDESVPSSVSAYLREIGHQTSLAQDILSRGTADALVAAAADEQTAIVVAMNCKHFERLARQRDKTGAPRFPNMGLIALDCKEESAASRLSEFMHLIETEYVQAQTREDK